MVDERGDATGDVQPAADGDADDVSARLAELHRRSEELAQRVAGFRSDTEQLMSDAGSVDGTARSQTPEPDRESEQTTEQHQQPDGEQAAAEPRRPRPRPSADAPLRYDEDAAPGGGAAAPAAASAATAGREAEPQPEAEKTPTANGTRPEPEPGPTPEPKTEAKPEPKTEPKTGPKTGPKADKPEADKPKEKRPRRGLPSWVRKARNLVVTVVIIVAAALALRTWVVTPFYVPSASMEPTLHGCSNCNNDHVLVQKIAYYFHDPRRGDIIVFSKPSNWHVNDSDLIKRVIGVPGDKLVLRKGRVFVNGHKLDESYVKKCKSGTRPENGRSSWKVPKKRLFVMGDNRCNSEDSRQFGTVPIDNVVGEAFLIYWPVSRFGSP